MNCDIWMTESKGFELKGMIVDQLNVLSKRRAVMVSYLEIKMGEEDWHGVQDAASDLRDIDVEIATLEEVAKNG